MFSHALRELSFVGGVCACPYVLMAGFEVQAKHFKTDKKKNIDKYSLLIAEAISSEHQLKQTALKSGKNN